MSPNQASLKLEGWAGIEPANTGFADPRVSHFATSPCHKLISCCDCLQIQARNFQAKIENPPASSISGGGYIGDGSLFSALAQPFPHARMRLRTADRGATTHLDGR